MGTSIWGDAFVIEDTKTKAKTIKNKIAKTKEVSIEKKIASKTTSISEKLELIKAEVNRILGVYKENTICIRDKESFIRYIDKAIQNGVIAIDTETNNSLDPISCKLMGACIYTPGEKNAYIPINHTDLEGSLLSNQLTESDIKEQFARLRDTKIIMHNAKFDYEVISCTCGIKLNVFWDTFIGARMLNENELAGLKWQYINKIDPSIEKYDIEKLFNIEYKYVDPDIFALYAATDAFMTYKLYLWQKAQFELPDNARVFEIFNNVEMKVMPVVADMELTGICIDSDYAKRLHNKYEEKQAECQAAVAKELQALRGTIDEWRNSPEANIHPKTYATDTNADVKKFPFQDSTGRYKEGKSKADQLEDPIATTSAIQLAILLYDILQMPVVDPENPRGTGTPVLEALVAETGSTLCKAIIEQRTVLKLMTAFIDPLPEMVSKVDNRLHAHFNQLGTDTGRFSSTQPNLQQVPSKNNEIRLLFCAQDKCVDKAFEDYFEVYNLYEVKLNDGRFVQAKLITTEDVLENNLQVLKIEELDNNYRRIYCG